MKLDPKTVTVLKNFSTIQSGLIFNTGNVLSTLSPQKSVMAKATVPDDFPVEFAIFDLSRFLNVLSLFDSPEIEFGENHLKVVSGDSSVKYVYAAKSTIMAPPPKPLVLPSQDVQFELTEAMMSRVHKAMATLGAPDFAIVGSGGKMSIRGLDVKNKEGDMFSSIIGDTDRDFMVVFKSENLKMMPMTYQVTVSAKGISHFKGTDIDYWIAIDQSSVFE